LKQRQVAILISGAGKKETPMRNVFYRNPGHEYPSVVGGQGVYLYDSEGREYLDGSGGAAVSCLGHGHPEVIAAIKKQLDQLAFAHTAYFTSEPQEKLAQRLVRHFGEDDARVYFLSGGSEANETALKLARQYWIACGRSEKTVVISRHQSFHGNTLGALALSGSPGRRDIYAPMLQDWPKIEPCYAYRHQEAGESDEEYGGRSAEALETAILELGAENIAAFFAETVVGATLGAVPAVGAYFQKIREICDRHEVLLVLDEIMCGSGRTGTYFAFAQEAIMPDIVTVAKGLGGGYQPVGATISRGFIYRQIAEAGGSFAHGHTYVGHAAACAAGLAVADVIEKENLLDNVTKIGGVLKKTLEEMFADHPNIGNIRGRGMFLGIELVRDRETKEPVRASLGLPEKIKTGAMSNGLVCYPAGGTADGREGAHILLAPPFIYNRDHVDELAGKLKKTLDSIDFA
jgi:adenosylmethionine-8-amino-7-oxononanoate aminotransferase